MTAPTAVAQDGERLPRQRALQLVVLALACVALCAAAYLVAVRTTWGQRADTDALEGRAADRARIQEATGDLLATVSIASIVFVGGTIMLVALLRRHPLVALGAGVVILGANVTTQMLKEALPRPDLVADEVLGPANSYPSGHTTVAISLGVAAVLAVPGAVRGLVAIAGTGYGALVGAATVTSGWHYPSDAIGAYFVAVAWGAAVAALLLWLRGSRRRRPRPPADAPLVGPLLFGFGITLLVVAFLATVGTSAALESGRLDAVDVTRVYVVSLAAIVGVVTFLMAVFLFCQRGVHLERLAVDDGT